MLGACSLPFLLEAHIPSATESTRPHPAGWVASLMSAASLVTEAAGVMEAGGVTEAGGRSSSGNSSSLLQSSARVLTASG